MKQVITAKLKLELSTDQKQLVRQITLAYRDALNYASGVAFKSNKMSSGVALQKKVYNHLRSVFGLPAPLVMFLAKLELLISLYGLKLSKMQKLLNHLIPRKDTKD